MDRKTQSKINVIAFVITFFVMSGIVGAVLAIEIGSGSYLHWAARHPALHAKYDPHHWLMKLAILALWLSCCHAIAVTVREPLAKAVAWRRVFVPLPWGRCHRQESCETNAFVQEERR